MNQSNMEPEFILAQSEKMHLTEKQLECIVQNLLTVEVDLVVLSKQALPLADMLGRITGSIRALRLSLLELEYEE